MSSKQYFFILFIFLFGFITGVKSQKSIPYISEPTKKYYLQFYVHEQPKKDAYISLRFDTCLLQKYNNKSLPSKKQADGSILVFRTFFKLDSLLSDAEMAFHIGSLNYPCRIFCNGKLIYTLGSYKDLYTSRIRFSSGIMLPPDLLKYNGINELSIQIYQRYNDSFSLGKIFISSKKVVDEYTFIRNFVSVNLIQATLILSIILAIYFMFLFLLMHNKMNIKYLFYAAFCVFLSLGYSNISFSFNYVNELLVYKISRVSLPFSCLFLIYFTITSTRVFELKRLNAIIFAIPILVFVALFLMQTTLPGIERIMKYYASIANIPYLLFAFILVVLSYIKTRRKRDLALLFGYMVLFVAIYYDTVNYIGNITPYTWLVPHGFLVFILVVFFVLSTDQTRSFNLSVERGKELQEMKDNLENIIEDRTKVIKAQNEEFKTQSDSLEEAYFEIMRNKNVIEKSHKSMTDSILYAKLIQQAVLPSPEIIGMILPEHFIFSQASHIVSGDFYFIKQVRQYTIVCAIDCTGHGVPGAFLSMLGTALINEIVINKEITKANLVLDELRDQIKKSLQQTGREGERQEGMDIAFCSIDLETMRMSFAGAHNPLWLFRPVNENESVSGNLNYDLIELPADRQSVSINLKEKPFTEKTIDLESGDIFYLFTDGYSSQFSYKTGATYKSNRFKELLSQICHLPAPEQKAIIEESFNEWKGNTPQTDDVLVIGVRI